MEISDDLIRRLCDLARLNYDEAEAASLKKDLQRMIAFIEKLNEVDTTGVEPLIFLTDHLHPLREDSVSSDLPREQALELAPDRNGSFFQVPPLKTA
ncbi:Asp-tRNA(Asn)/Glu-tRNA(Gln) amidotransferase subunit GatC [Thermoflavifilum thermophilum]|uniref:Aspartyl/glutamyl-tRNA(Asn/Gln) amidotransferase subunit C n=1 Tax=Thermoflavifilum thermophilum TaxID=1393122 RepID=A0A1I7NFV0_9BACT|nr:Asp-tRNA(Asn)/Glu-tRNA(Gln) amidotransferase subunit GatC [Thermoflavifilum thermophilum]SFV33520.1 aspartyl/glutamyl-tRNA(Asn/Gln) amidotransferase subunit C [Thermoflavifilum thermophilum]